MSLQKKAWLISYNIVYQQKYPQSWTLGMFQYLSMFTKKTLNHLNFSFKKEGQTKKVHFDFRWIPRVRNEYFQ